MISARIENLPALTAALRGYGSQIPFAVSVALTSSAHAVNRAIQAEMRSDIAGGPTPYTLRSFQVTPATKQTQQAIVGLKTAPAGGTPYEQAIGHLFRGGVRRFKRLEGWLEQIGILPSGQQIVPGSRAPLDRRGNVKLAEVKEMVGILAASKRGLRNLRSYRRAGRGKEQKALGFFVVRPGDPAASHLAPGIWRRIDSAAGSAVEQWFVFASPGRYSQQFDLEKIADESVARTFPAAFQAALDKAIATARS